jgi:flagellar motor switch protein FliG
VIANLDQDVAGQVLELLPDSIQPEILHRVARLGPITPEAVDTLRTMLANRSGAGGQSAGVMLGGTKEAARILSGARKTTEQRVMPKLFKIDREVAKAIEEALFVFENLLDMDDKNLGTLIRNIDSDLLTRALKGVDEATRNRFLGCMSSRAADGIRDEMEARGPMKLSEVLDAQKAIIQLARALAKDGTIMMGGDDDYV